MPQLTTATQNAADAPHNMPLTFVYLDVAGDPLWAWSGRAPITITVPSDPLLAGGQTFIGAGDVGQVGAITHAADGSVQTMQLSLGYADLSSADALGFVNDVASWSQRPAVVWQAFARLDAAGGVLIDAPFRMMTARMIYVGTVNGKSPALSIKLASKSATDGQRASGWRLADAHQQRFYAGDTALAYIPQLMNRELRFGVRDNTPGTPGGGRNFGDNEFVRPL